MIDQKIKNILNDLHIAHLKSEQFYAGQLKPGEPTKPIDLFSMALAFESEDRLLMEYELALSEKFPQHYSDQQRDFFQKEIERLTHRIRAWQNKQFPSQTERR